MWRKGDWRLFRRDLQGSRRETVVAGMKNEAMRTDSIECGKGLYVGNKHLADDVSRWVRLLFP